MTMRASVLLSIFVAQAPVVMSQSSVTPSIDPDPLVLADGTAVSSAEIWKQKRRPEIRELFDRHVYGRMPARPDDVEFDLIEEDRGALGGAATRRQVIIRMSAAMREDYIELLLYVPNGVERAPAFLGLNFYGNHTVSDDKQVLLSSSWVPARGKGVIEHRATDAARGTSAQRWAIRQTVERGYAVATIYHGDLDPDRDDFSDGVHPLYYRGEQERPADDEWGALAAWAWGLHRALDYLVTAPGIDPKRIAVVGHSRNGKAALLAGATDERFALVISNQSGCGGAALSRRRVGETVKKINDRFPHWFCVNFRAFNERETELPVDQHMLIALCAPRPVLVCSAEGDAWADPEGEFLALVGADPVYQLLGMDGLAVDRRPPAGLLIRSTLGYHIRPGRHGIGPVDWAVFVDFADRHL